MKTCTKQDLFDTLQFEEGDSVFIVLKKKDGKIQRITHGFDWFELFGCAEFVKTDMLTAMHGGLDKQRITEITRIRILDEKDIEEIEKEENGKQSPMEREKEVEGC